MKTSLRFFTPALLVAMLVCVSRLAAQPNFPSGHPAGRVADLLLSIQGPLIFCEDHQNGRPILRAMLAPLVGDSVDASVRHFKPALYSNDSVYIGSGDYEIQIKPEAVRTPHMDNSRGALDSAAKPCPASTDRYLTMAFPMPDEVMAIAPALAAFDENCDGHPSPDAYYATQVAFRYKKVSLDDVRLLCNAGSCSIPGGPTFPFDPKILFFPGQGSVLRFEVKPAFEDDPSDPHGHAVAVALAMRKLMRDEKHHCFVPRERVPAVVRTPVHDCHAPELLLCEATGSLLCQQQSAEK